MVGVTAVFGLLKFVNIKAKILLKIGTVKTPFMAK